MSNKQTRVYIEVPIARATKRVFEAAIEDSPETCGYSNNEQYVLLKFQEDKLPVELRDLEKYRLSEYQEKIGNKEIWQNSKTFDELPKVTQTLLKALNIDPRRRSKQVATTSSGLRAKIVKNIDPVKHIDFETAIIFFICLFVLFIIGNILWSYIY